jgi:hypothetical protein
VANDDLSKLAPYELGETGDACAVPYLIRHLYRGGPNEQRLAASAVGKLAQLKRALDEPARQVMELQLAQKNSKIAQQ